MTLTPEEFERIQYERVSMLGFDLMETEDETYPYRVEKHGKVVSRPLRSILDVSAWVDGQEDEEAAAREKFDG